ncbi:MAG: hypothetical protein E3J30_09495 [Anaerolineales bacterium]|nr:MAG: hypothetical protein E3J30_09495 [Anaerolineales bacterium]
MLQKIIVGTLVAALSGVLIVGAINRTEAKSEQVAQEQEANSGRLAREEAQELLQQNQGQQGQGNRASYAETDMLESGSRGGGQGRFSEVTNGSQPEDAIRGGEGSASVDEWLEVVGTVVSMNEEELVLQLQDGQEMVVECKAWTYALELGFTTDIGHEIKLYGFYEDTEFEVGGFEDLTAQLKTMVREENGRPFWAGGSGRGA